MPSGRKLVLRRGGQRLAGLRSKTFTWGSESIDMSSEDDDGVRIVAEEGATEQIDITAEGISKNTEFLALCLTNPGTSRIIEDVTLEWPSYNGGQGAQIACDFRISSYEETGPHNDAMTFNITLESTGLWVFTPGA